MDITFNVIAIIVMYIVGIHVGRNWDSWNSED